MQVRIEHTLVVRDEDQENGEDELPPAHLFRYGRQKAISIESCYGMRDLGVGRWRDEGGIDSHCRWKATRACCLAVSSRSSGRRRRSEKEAIEGAKKIRTGEIIHPPMHWSWRHQCSIEVSPTGSALDVPTAQEWGDCFAGSSSEGVIAIACYASFDPSRFLCALTC